ncbi:MAG: glycoside hydrolase family 9 protein [Bacteroidales bacterium]|nr:glycoside hydrolase family 9 protein [Bacteroidales bacterium]MDT8431994.1 glycoside hydrolase family 9 protein [Bacteroidales bacterium]
MKKSGIFLIPMAVAWLSLAIPACTTKSDQPHDLKLNELGYFECGGVNFLVFSNWYNGMFSDSKMSGIEVIHHEVRTVTNGDVRLGPTPEQWDPIPVFVDRHVDTAGGFIEAALSYPDDDFHYSIKATVAGSDLVVQVILDTPLPAKLAGKAGFNLEFLPSACFHRTYMMDGHPRIFPVYASGDMEITEEGTNQPLPLATGRELVVAPEDPARRITVSSAAGDICFYDGRNKAQNGWFVARTLIPTEKTGVVVEWTLSASSLPNWNRPPVIGHSQVGYHPDQQKVAVIELDGKNRLRGSATLIRILPDGSELKRLSGLIKEWGQYLRYHYGTFDFSEVTGEGTYVIQYDGYRTDPFIIAPDVYEHAWQPALDIFFPVQMDHMLVNEAYRVWHGAAHLDDARQAPVDHVHFDLYAQGPTTDTPYEPGEHIPGLNVGGWFDAGDYDIRTQSQYATVMGLVQVWERFGIERDQTLVDREAKYVDIHVPDGVPDILQQIEHGAIALLAQHEAVGHAIPGIIVPDISQYTHLGDALTMTDNLLYDPDMGINESNGYYSGKADDRWAFTSRSSALNYGSAAALAATSRVLRSYNGSFAVKCLETAERVWTEEHGREPDIFRVGNTTGGRLEFEELRAAVELLEATGRPVYRERILEMIPVIEEAFGYHAQLAVRIMPYMDEAFRNRVKELTRKYKVQVDSLSYRNPYGVPITRGGWAGNGTIMTHAVTNYYLYQAFPDIMEKEDVFEGVHYIFGRHPGSSVSFASGVGVRPKMVAYGMNRADFSFIAGGVVPGVLILPPDFPENKEDWPFLWGENEYVITMGAPYIFMVKAAAKLLNE